MKYYAEPEFFLRNINKLAKNKASILVNGELQSLPHSFWIWTEIKAALSMRNDWEVDSALTPFYGDWHDLFCLKIETGEIVVIDDNRDVKFTWPSAEAFMHALSEQELEYDLSGMEVLSVWKSPDFEQKLAQYLKKK